MAVPVAESMELVPRGMKRPTDDARARLERVVEHCAAKRHGEVLDMLQHETPSGEELLMAHVELNILAEHPALCRRCGGSSLAAARELCARVDRASRADRAAALESLAALDCCASTPCAAVVELLYGNIIEIAISADGEEPQDEEDDDKELMDAVRHYDRAATLGEASAQFILGIISAQAAEAARQFALAAAQGHAMAMYRLAMAHYNGRGVTRDVMHAARLFRGAHERGVSMASYELAMLYINGVADEEEDEDEDEDAVVPRDALEGFRILTSETVVRDNLSRINMAIGSLYARGLGVPRDMLRAVAIYAAEAERQCGTACCALFELLSRGARGLPIDRAKAFHYLFRGASPPIADPVCCFLMGLFAVTGEHPQFVPQDVRAGTAIVNAVAQAAADSQRANHVSLLPIRVVFYQFAMSSTDPVSASSLVSRAFQSV